MNELTLGQEQNAVALASKALTQDIAEAHEAMGMLKAFNFVEKLLTVSSLKVLNEIKNSKKYKGLNYINQDGKVLTVSTWEEYCTACGLSFKHINENLLNLSKLGEDFLETSQRLGLGYREMRKLRQLPEDALAEIVEADYSEATDKEDLIEKIEDLTAKHAQEKQILEGKLKQSQDNYEAQAKVLKNKNDQIDRLDTELAKKKQEIETRTPDKKGGDLRKEVSQLAYGAEAILRGQVRPGFDALIAHSEESGIDHTQFMSGVVAEIELALIELKEAYGLNDVPSINADDWASQGDQNLGHILDDIITGQEK